jgi:uncharacterized protein (DUF362 family)
MINLKNIAYYFDEDIIYPTNTPFNPSTNYPEYPFQPIPNSLKSNKVYDSVRQLFFLLGFDKENYGTKDWNPLGCFILPGMNVLIKPNMVRHFHPLGLGTDCLITHGSVIRVICDYVIIALKGKGKITIGDAPIQGADFFQLTEINGTKDIIEFYKKSGVEVDIELIDFRQTVAVCNKKGLILKTFQQENVKFTYVNLGLNSFFANLENRKYAIADYPYGRMKEYHDDDVHKYLVPESLLQADVIINIPKPKTHRFSGLTGAMKNFIGVNSQKENLPHHSIGSKIENGDEYPEKNLKKKYISKISNIITILSIKNLYLLSLPFYFLRSLLIRSVNKSERIFKGAWYGNDTIWRTILDINRIVLYANKKGGPFKPTFFQGLILSFVLSEAWQ